MTTSLPAGNLATEEIEVKLRRLRTFLNDQSFDAVLLTRQTSVAWLTAGMDHVVVRLADPGFAWALVSRDEAVILALNNEGPRLADEEKVTDLGFQLRLAPWWNANLVSCAEELITQAGFSNVANDGFGPGMSVPVALQKLRLQLMEGERQRFSELGNDVCQVVEGALTELSPAVMRTMSERQLAAKVSAGFEERGILAGGMLIGGSERRERFRHPTVSEAILGSSLVIVVVGVRGGLHVALSRLVSAGSADAEMVSRHAAACSVEGALIDASRPGATWLEAFEAGIQAYASLGFVDEWKEHTQGGPIGYGPREFVVTPSPQPSPLSLRRIEGSEAFAWNPTVQGTKSEDTFMLIDGQLASVSNSTTWPMVDVPKGPARPAILEV